MLYFAFFSLFNFSSIFTRGSADPICPYVRTPMWSCVVDAIPIATPNSTLRGVARGKSRLAPRHSNTTVKIYRVLGKAKRKMGRLRDMPNGAVVQLKGAHLVADRTEGGRGPKSDGHWSSINTALDGRRDSSVGRAGWSSKEPLRSKPPSVSGDNFFYDLYGARLLPP